MSNRFLVLSFAVLAILSGNVAAQSSKPLKVGDQAPDFELEGLDGKNVKLSDRFGKEGRPVVLLFSRASW